MSAFKLVSAKGQEQGEDRFSSLTPGLYLVATPIGNLRDITLRALDVLRGAALILAEDTRHSRKLLERYEVRTPMKAFHEHSNEKARQDIISRLKDGQALAMISDAGTPLISDPGYKLVREVLEKGLPVFPIPGASAVLAALCMAGLPTDKFLFAGFLPPKTTARKKALAELGEVPGSLVFYESPNRLAASLVDMAEVFGDRQAAIARELTKVHESLYRGGLLELAAQFANTRVKGECVIVIGPPERDKPQMNDAQIDAALLSALQTAGVKAASREVAKQSGRPSRELYSRALQLNKQQENGIDP